MPLAFHEWRKKIAEQYDYILSDFLFDITEIKDDKS